MPSHRDSYHMTPHIFAGILATLMTPTGLTEGPGVNLVRAHCTSCHSERLITQNSGTRADWKRTIRWMQATQNLWQIEPAAEEKILDYLAQNYPAKRAFRRPPLHPSLMPSKHRPPVAIKGARPPADSATHARSSNSSGGCSCRSMSPATPGALMPVMVWLVFRSRRLWNRR